MINSSLLLCRDYWTRTSDLAPPRRVRYQLRQIPIIFQKCCKDSDFVAYLQIYVSFFCFKMFNLHGFM